MATFLPQIQDVTPELKLYSPNFELMEKWLSVKQERYDQNALALGTMYSSLKQLPLSLEENITSRDQFLKDAENQVKRLAEVDLSLPQNYKAARGIFTPLLEDEALMTDVSFTLKQNALLRTNQAFKNSFEEEDRKRYNANNDIYAALKLEEFRNSTPERRSAMAKSGVSFTNNVNIFERAQKIAKDNGLDIVYESSPTDKNGNINQVVFKYKNGEKVVGVAYNKLMGTLGKDPFVQDYYKQQGYINVQSELQQLAPIMGYEAALQTVVSKYGIDEISIKESQEKLATAESERVIKSSQVANYESKISSEGIIPGSKEHRDYLRLKAESQMVVEEASQLQTQAFEMGIAGSASLENAYANAGRLALNTDIKSAAYDMAMSESSKEMVANPLFEQALKVRKLEIDAMKAAKDGGGQVTYDQNGMPVLSYAEQDAAVSGEDVSTIELAEGKDKIEVISNGLAQDAKDLISPSNPDGLYGMLDMYSQAGGTFEGYDNGRLAPRSIVTEINNLIEAGNFSGAEQKIQQVTDIVAAGVKDGTVSGAAAIKFQEYSTIKADLDKKYADYTQSLIETLPIAKQALISKNVGIFQDNPEAIKFLDYLVGPKGLRSKDEFAKAIDEAFVNDQFSPELNEYLAQGARALGLKQIALPRARNKFIEDITTGKSVLPDMYLEPKYDKTTGQVTLNTGKVVSLEQAWDMVLSPRLKSERIRAEEDYYRNNRAEWARDGRANIGSNVRKIYDNVYTQFSDLYDQTNYSPYGAITEVDNGSYAIERLSTVVPIDPVNLDGKSQNLSDNLILTTKGILKRNQGLLFTGSINDVIGGKKEISNRDKKVGLYTEDNPAFKVLDQFSQDYLGAKNQNKSVSASLPRAQATTLSNVLIGDERYTAIQITPTNRWSVSAVNTGDSETKPLDAGTETTITMLIPQEVASANFRLPTTKDEHLYSAAFSEGIQYEVPGGGAFSIIPNEYGGFDLDANIEVFDPETGDVDETLIQGQLPGALMDFTYQYDNIIQQIESQYNLNTQNRKTYKSNNGAIRNSDDLTQ